MIRKRVVFYFVAPILLLSGCYQAGDTTDVEQPVSSVEAVVSKSTPSEASVESMVAQKAEKRWRAIIEKDYFQAYTFIAPGARALISQSQFQKNAVNSPLLWGAVDMVGVNCDEGKISCSVSATVTYTYSGLIEEARGEQMSSVITESWIFTEDEWWYYPGS